MTRKAGQPYPWYRMYTEARTDTKLRALTKPQHYVWFNLLCLSADQDDRGIITGYESELLAVEVADGDETLLAETIERLVKFRILEVVDGGWRFINFTSRQYDKPSDTPEETSARKRDSRAKTIVSRDVTPSHAMSRPGHAPSRIEAEEEGEGEAETEQEAETLPGGGGGQTSPRARARGAAPASATISTTDKGTSAEVIALCERIATRTRLPQRPDVLEQLAGVLTTHLARGLSPGDIERDVWNLIDPSHPRHTARPTVSKINNWLTHTQPAANFRSVSDADADDDDADRADHGHHGEHGDARAERGEDRHGANGANGHAGHAGHAGASNGRTGYAGRRPLVAVAGGRRQPIIPDPTNNGDYAHLFTVSSDDDPDEE